MKRNAKKLIVIAGLAFFIWGSAQVTYAATNFWGNYQNLSTPHRDPNTPVPSSSRSYFVTSVKEIPDGAELTVELFQGELNSAVSLHLQVAINDGKGNVVAIPFKRLSDNVSDNPTNYYSRRVFKLTYQELNDELRKVLPANVQHLEIGPGTPLFLLGEWPRYSHTWGGLGRGGIFFMPEAGQRGTAQQSSSLAQRRPEELDLAYPISNMMGLKYNKSVEGKESGLQVGGQIRSRLESEGKFQIPLQKLEEVKKKLFDMANDPALAEKVLGPDWTITPELRYMKKDSAGNMILDKKTNLPIPDPMVDTYYDNANFDGAKRDMALRYRWTEGNATGSWNFKPGLTHASPDGIVNRIEFGVDTTDDRPKTIKNFADSMDPLNPFKVIREIIPGSTPSSFLKPSIKITDTRFKFKLQHKNGLVIEVSLDDVLANSLRGSNKVRYAQLEMDIDHLSTTSANVAKTIDPFAYMSGRLTYEMTNFLTPLDGQAFLDGRPVIHTVADLEPGSLVLKKHEDDFRVATEAIIGIRKHTVGRSWLPAPQKASLAAVLLKHVDAKEASGSVRALLDRVQRLKKSRVDLGPLSEKPSTGGRLCGRAFN